MQFKITYKKSAKCLVSPNYRLMWRNAGDRLIERSREADDLRTKLADVEAQLATVTAERDMLARELQAQHGVTESAYDATLADARAISVMQDVHRLR